MLGLSCSYKWVIIWAKAHLGELLAGTIMRHGGVFIRGGERKVLYKIIYLVIFSVLIISHPSL